MLLYSWLILMGGSVFLVQTASYGFVVVVVELLTEDDRGASSTMEP